MSSGSKHGKRVVNREDRQTLYASSAFISACLPPATKLFPRGPTATVTRRPSRMNVKTSPYCKACVSGATNFKSQCKNTPFHDTSKESQWGHFHTQLLNLRSGASEKPQEDVTSSLEGTSENWMLSQLHCKREKVIIPLEKMH